MSDEAETPEKLTLWQKFMLRRAWRQSGRTRRDQLDESDWGAIWTAHASRSGKLMHRVFAALPGGHRCGMCGVPFDGAGSLATRPLGYEPSRKCPTLCRTCVEGSPPGGSKMQTGVLFADLRGFTAASESADPSDVSATLRRFYSCAESTLFPRAIIDKLIGDEVMALYLPYLESWGSNVPELMVEHARDLLGAVGYGTAEGPFVEVGIGIDYGEAYVGNIGDRSLYDFTAVGDVVNTAARLQGHAGGGQVVYSERLAGHLGNHDGEAVQLTLKGKAEPVAAFRLAV